MITVFTVYFKKREGERRDIEGMGRGSPRETVGESPTEGNEKSPRK
jgi:hypothetical protein